MATSSHHPDRIMTTKEVSAYLRIPVSSLWALTKKGKIPGTKVGKHWRYRASDIEAFLRGTLNQEPTPKTPEEKRKHPRLNTDLEAKFSVSLNGSSGRAVPAVIANISQSGVLILVEESQAGVGLGDPVQMQFALHEMNLDNMEIQGRVIHLAHNGKARIGIKFRMISKESEGAIKRYVG